MVHLHVCVWLCIKPFHFSAERLGGIAVHACNHAITVLLGVADIDVSEPASI